MTCLCTLDLLGALKAEVVEAALRDGHPAVRRQALRLAEARAKNAPHLIEAAARLVNDPEAKVRLQLACTLGEWDDPRAGEALAKLAVKDADDPFIAGAVMSSALKHYPAVAAAVAASDKPVPAKMMQDLFATALGVGNRDVTAKLVESFLSPRVGEGRYTAAQLDSFRGWLDTLAQHNSSLAKLRDAAHDALSDRLSRAGELFASARASRGGLHAAVRGARRGGGVARTGTGQGGR